jgi:hypothetical protein
MKTTSGTRGKRWADSTVNLRSERGVALMLSMLVLVAVSILAIGLSNDVTTDKGVTNNFRRYTEAFNRGESSTDLTFELVRHFLDERGVSSYGYEESYFFFYFDDNYYFITVDPVGQSFYSNGGTVRLYGTDGPEASVEVVRVGKKAREGGSIIMAAGYEGLGKSSAHGGFDLWYGFEGTGRPAVGGEGGTPINTVYRIVP